MLGLTETWVYYKRLKILSNIEVEEQKLLFHVFFSFYNYSHILMGKSGLNICEKDSKKYYLIGL